MVLTVFLSTASILASKYCSIVFLEFFNPLSSQRMFQHLFNNTVRNSCQIRSGFSTFDNMTGVSDTGWDDLRFDIMRFEYCGNISDQTDTAAIFMNFLPLLLPALKYQLNRILNIRTVWREFSDQFWISYSYSSCLIGFVVNCSFCRRNFCWFLFLSLLRPNQWLSYSYLHLPFLKYMCSCIKI